MSRFILSAAGVLVLAAAAPAQDWAKARLE